MNPHLVDRLVCPRCGPPFGLILLADLVEEGRVMQGVLGCPNCRDRFPVSRGAVDLRPPPRTVVDPDTDPIPTPGVEILHVAAALGITDGPGVLVLMGTARGAALRLSEMVPDVEVVAAGNLFGSPPPSVSVIQVRGRLPFQDSGVRGLVMDRGDLAAWSTEAARVLKTRHRLVLIDGEDGAGSKDKLEAELVAAGLTLVLADSGISIVTL